MKRDRFSDPVHREVAKNVAALRTGAFHAAAFKRHVRKFFYIEEFRTAQMIVTFFDARIDAAHVDLRRDRGILRMLPIDLDRAAELREFSVSRAKKLVDVKTNG